MFPITSVEPAMPRKLAGFAVLVSSIISVFVGSSFVTEIPVASELIAAVIDKPLELIAVINGDSV
jgi:hypothetical protein